MDGVSYSFNSSVLDCFDEGVLVNGEDYKSIVGVYGVYNVVDEAMDTKMNDLVLKVMKDIQMIDQEIEEKIGEEKETDEKEIDAEQKVENNIEVKFDEKASPSSDLLKSSPNERKSISMNLYLIEDDETSKIELKNDVKKDNIEEKVRFNDHQTNHNTRNRSHSKDNKGESTSRSDRDRGSDRRKEERKSDRRRDEKNSDAPDRPRRSEKDDRKEDTSRDRSRDHRDSSRKEERRSSVKRNAEKNGEHSRSRDRSRDKSRDSSRGNDDSRSSLKRGRSDSDRPPVKRARDMKPNSDDRSKDTRSPRYKFEDDGPTRRSSLRVKGEYGKDHILKVKSKMEEENNKIWTILSSSKSILSAVDDIDKLEALFNPPEFEIQTKPNLQGTIRDRETLKECIMEYQAKHVLYTNLYKALKNNRDQFNALNNIYIKSGIEDKDRIVSNIRDLYNMRKIVVNNILTKFNVLHDELRSINSAITEFSTYLKTQE